MIRAGVVPKYFSAEEIEKFKRIFYALPDQSNNGTFAAYTNGIDHKHILWPMIDKLFKQRIQQYFTHEFEISQVMLLKEQVPWGIHSDYWKNQSLGDPSKKPDMAFIIPLKIVGTEDAHTHTIVFDQECETEFVKDYVPVHQPLDHSAVDLVTSLCSHVKPEYLSLVSVREIMRWGVGDLIYFDRRLLHCSDNFPAVGIEEKQAIVAFTYTV